MGMYVLITCVSFLSFFITFSLTGAIMGSEDWKIYWRSFEGPYQMDNIAIMGANSYVCG